MRTILSGPAGGVVAAGWLAKRLGIRRAMSFDMGGTSTDVCLIEGQPRTTKETTLGGLPVAVPVLDVHSVEAGGMGARPTSDGPSGVHTHMTNSLNTPIEALESAYAVRVRRYSLRRGSGGNGAFHGGDGIVREIEFLTRVRGSILSDRRRFPPYGLQGGKQGKAGKNILILPYRKLTLPSKTIFEAPAGAVLRIETPGGGGWGAIRSQEAKGKRQR